MNSASPLPMLDANAAVIPGCCADPQPFDLSLETVRLDVPDGTGVRTIFLRALTSAASGAMLGIRGPSGAGENVFLKCLSGIITPTEGVVRWGTLALSQCTESVRDRWRGQHCGFLFKTFGFLKTLQHSTMFCCRSPSAAPLPRMTAKPPAKCLLLAASAIPVQETFTRRDAAHCTRASSDGPSCRHSGR